MICSQCRLDLLAELAEAVHLLRNACMPPDDGLEWNLLRHILLEKHKEKP